MIPKYMQNRAGEPGSPLPVEGFDGWDAFRESDGDILLYDHSGRQGSIRRVGRSSDNRGQNWTLYAVRVPGGTTRAAELTAAILGGYCRHTKVWSWRDTDFVEHYVDSSG